MLKNLYYTRNSHFHVKKSIERFICSQIRVVSFYFIYRGIKKKFQVFPSERLKNSSSKVKKSFGKGLMDPYY